MVFTEYTTVVCLVWLVVDFIISYYINHDNQVYTLLYFMERSGQLINVVSGMCLQLQYRYLYIILCII